MARKKKITFIILCIVLLSAIYLPGFSRLQELREQNRKLEHRIEILTKANEELKKRIDKLKGDLTYIERIARERLGMVRKNEIILR